MLAKLRTIPADLLVVDLEDGVAPAEKNTARKTLLEAAAVPETFFTVWTNVFARGRLQAGERLLVHGGASGIGTTAIQLGTAFGAKVIVTVGDDTKAEACEALGAVKAINYREEDFVQRVEELTDGRGADVIYDPVGGDTFERSMKCIAFEGRLLVIGFAGGHIPSAQMNRVLLKNISLVGLNWGAHEVQQPERVLGVEPAADH